MQNLSDGDQLLRRFKRGFGAPLVYPVATLLGMICPLPGLVCRQIFLINTCVFLHAGVPLNEESELEDAIQMDEPEIENEQNEAFGDDMSEYEEDEDTENDEEEEDTEVGKAIFQMMFEGSVISRRRGSQVHVT